MTNIFLLDFPAKLKYWVNLRKECTDLDTMNRCIAIDNFWQNVPLVNHYLHPDFIKDWPNPWELLNDNTYCYYARALGMIYTLLLLGNKDVELVEAVDDNNNEVVLVLVDKSKYVLNYWPNMVVNSHITDFKIKKSLDISPLYNKIGL